MASKPEARVDSEVLLVTEKGVGLSFAEIPVSRLDYCFVDEGRRDGFAAWERESSPGYVVIDVAGDCRALEGGFQQQALNRFVAQALIRERPRVLVVSGLWGCTVDLPRIAGFMGVPTIFLPHAWPKLANECAEPVQTWIRDAMSSCRYVGDELRDFWGEASLDWMSSGSLIGIAEVERSIGEIAAEPPADYQFSYSTYEFLSRDHPLLAAMQAPDTRHFDTGQRVLDLACGAGIFMDLLRQRGIEVVGVERDPDVSAYGRGMGLDIRTEDALQYLRTTEESFDGVYCSHFIEHLPVDVVQELLLRLHQCIAPGGALVLTFPDPESIRSQLLGFWRDPEHQRFYHPELVISMATACGFSLDWSSYGEQPHEVIPFPLEPATLPELTVIEAPAELPYRPGLLERAMMKLGWQSRKRAELTQDNLSAWAVEVGRRLQEQKHYIEQLKERTDTLWKVNQTWGWSDNVTLRFRRGQAV